MGPVDHEYQGEWVLRKAIDVGCRSQKRVKRIDADFPVSDSLL